MRLHFREYGDPAAAPVLLLHGLFGSSANWHGIARKLESRYRIISPDLRNPGRSPPAAPMDYPAMAGDLLELMDDLALREACLVGHSMGGKAAMWLTLTHPCRVRALVPVDMAPVAYRHSFDGILGALDKLSLAALGNRADVDAALAEHLEEPNLRAYLLQNLVKTEAGWRWRINLPVLKQHAADITGFPATAPAMNFPGDVLFIYGGRSHYVSEQHNSAIRHLFPYARLRMIPQAGHWVYSEAPEDFVSALLPFLDGACAP